MNHLGWELKILSNIYRTVYIAKMLSEHVGKQNSFFPTAVLSLYLIPYGQKKEEAPYKKPHGISGVQIADYLKQLIFARAHM